MHKLPYQALQCKQHSTESSHVDTQKKIDQLFHFIAIAAHHDPPPAILLTRLQCKMRQLHAQPLHLRAALDRLTYFGMLSTPLHDFIRKKSLTPPLK